MINRAKTKVRKYTPRYFWLKWQMKRDEDFLLKKGIRKVMQSGLELNVRAEYISSPQHSEKTGRVYLPPCKEDGVDSTALLVLAADDYPEVAKRYLSNKRRLSE